MAGHALERRNTLAAGPAHHVGEMAMPVVALLRIACRGVAVDAAGRGQYGVDLLPRGETSRGIRSGGHVADGLSRRTIASCKRVLVAV